MNLTDEEQKRLEQLEKIIFKGIKAFANVWEALLEIHDKALWRDEYTSFTSYCQQRFGIEKAHAYRLLAAGRYAEKCLHVETPAPETEAQARREMQAIRDELKSLPPEEKRRQIMEAEKELIEKARKPRTVGGAQQKDRLDSGLRAIRKTIRIFEGFGPEGDPVITKLVEARQAAEFMEILPEAA